MRDSQVKKMIKELKRRKIKNYEFRDMFILSYTRRLSDIRQLGFKIEKQRVYDKDGRATGVFEYWIPRVRKPKTDPTHKVDNMMYEIEEKPNWLQEKLTILTSKTRR